MTGNTPVGSSHNPTPRLIYLRATTKADEYKVAIAPVLRGRDGGSLGLLGVVLGDANQDGASKCSKQRAEEGNCACNA